MTQYRKGYNFEKMLVDRINDTGEWFAQRAPSSKGVDVIATSKKHYKTVFIEAKNTEQKDYRVEKAQIADLIKRAFVAGAEAFVAIHWRSRRDEEDKRRKQWAFYPPEFLAQKVDSVAGKTISFKPFDYHKSFEEVFGSGV